MQDHAPCLQDLISLAVVEHMRGKETDPGMVMLLVVPGKEGLTEGTGLFDAAESLWEVRPILEGFKLRLRKRVVVAGMRPAVGFGDT